MIRMLREEIAALRSQLKTMSSAPVVLGVGRSISEGADQQPVEALAAMATTSARTGSVGLGGTAAALTASAVAAQTAANAQSESVLSKLEMTEKLMMSLATPWEEKLSKTKAMQRERLEVLENHGLLLADRGNGKSVPVGGMVPKLSAPRAWSTSRMTRSHSTASSTTSTKDCPGSSPSSLGGTRP